MNEAALMDLQQLWTRHVQNVPVDHYVPIMRAFIEGYGSAASWKPPNWLLFPTAKSVAAVVTAMNEEKSIAAVLRELERLPFHEIILVINGSNDASFTTARKSTRAVIAHFSGALGHDVGRAVGTRLTRSDIVLFVDADFLVPAEQLIPFVRAVDGGMDVALNDIHPFMGAFADRDGVSMLKEFLNRAMNRPDLKVNSLTAVPHALSRKAIDKIGASQLAIPPKAQAIALSAGLTIGAAASVDVISANRLREGNKGTGNAVAELIIGDHVEALEWAMRDRNAPRLTFADHVRNRSRITGGG